MILTPETVLHQGSPVRGTQAVSSVAGLLFSSNVSSSYLLFSTLTMLSAVQSPCGFGRESVPGG